MIRSTAQKLRRPSKCIRLLIEMAQDASGERLRGVAQEVLGVVVYPGTEIMTDGIMVRFYPVHCGSGLTVFVLWSQTCI